MRARHTLLVLGLLAACGTPQEQCIRMGARDLHVMDRLIAESRATLQRGYAIEETEVDNWVWVVCGPPPMVNGQVAGPPRRCFENVPRIERRPKAVNLVEERAKLASMEAKRRQLAQEAAPVIAACKAKYPE
ncbi:hypothetical protein SAMN05421774_102523 [Gemmobacter megaterium]|uniref:Lipoprotein n=1 Tax=Gemmobacter megaterium TaxID=1086013 RepID=A0A1N7M9G5_9RHOB|nr:hypothetical protein [Gemmobacter megaterium]GGE08054.1 hypothetical protein GCM10011345_12160 [Gemmobacter megaterium]SIS82755.1 hypothetical protein SAMN05421774_102523 [Gemmobacter megaterium]